MLNKKKDDFHLGHEGVHPPALNSQIWNVFTPITGGIQLPHIDLHIGSQPLLYGWFA